MQRDRVPKRRQYIVHSAGFDLPNDWNLSLLALPFPVSFLTFNPVFLSFCGDRLVEGTEECDDGNTLSGDGCSATCQKEEPRPTLVGAAAVCGDGVLDSSEECDDGNTRDGDGCTTTCLLEQGICGDGIVERLLGEQCEQSLHDPSLPYQCVHCRYVSSMCGDGKVDPGEECDDGQRNSTAADASCRPDCSHSRCGDGILDSSEQCDDGNRLNGDGCDRFCQSENGAQTQIAGLFTRQTIDFSPGAFGSQTIDFPSSPSFAPLAAQLPLAELQPLIKSHAPKGQTGPAAVAVLAGGAASGLAWVRRKRREK